MTCWDWFGNIDIAVVSKSIFVPVVEALLSHFQGS